MAERVEIIINPATGEIEFEVNGVRGTSCTDITKLLSKGSEILQEQLTQEYYTPEELPAWTGE